MNRTEVCRRLHDLVDAMMEMPVDWFGEGLYPILRLKYRNLETGDAYTLVVGLEEGAEDD